MGVALVLLRCRTSDRTPAAGRGAETLAPLVGEALGVEPRVIGSPGEPRAARYDDDLQYGADPHVRERADHGRW